MLLIPRADPEKKFIIVSSVATIKKQHILSLNLWRAAVHPAAAQVLLAAAALPAEVAGAAVALVAVVRAVVGNPFLLVQKHTRESSTIFTPMPTSDVHCTVCASFHCAGLLVFFTSNLPHSGTDSYYFS